jgi:undecaprenyl phosphate N,N'-diacetylbacillosamine 1-phosphate transferase
MKHSYYKKAFKSIIDILVTIFFIILLSPLLLVIGISIRLIFGSPVLFIQNRPGYKGKIFKLIKFRTMLYKSDEIGKLLIDEYRLTKFGKLLRSTSLDELPELINVLKGEMSLVGPRPLLEEYLPLYSKEQARRHEVKPGITGWAQVNGRNAISWKQKFDFDVWYVDNVSFLLDIKILILTIVRIFQRQGITQEGQATMEKFRGNQD